MLKDIIKKYKNSLIQLIAISVILAIVNFLTGKNWLFIAYSIIKENLPIIILIYLAIVLFFVLYLGINSLESLLLNVIFSPLLVIFYGFFNSEIRKYLENFDQNIPREAVIILAHSDWKDPKTLIKNDFTLEDIKVIASYLNTKGSSFSFYTNATLEDICSIMGDKSIREIFFLGHGTSHTFRLSSNERLYYCDFDDREKYGKDFVHQMHCGSLDGKSLIDCVVSEENKDKCFFFRKYINSNDIKKEFKKLEKNLLGYDN